MARRRAIPKVKHTLKVQPAVGASPGDLWDQSGWKLPAHQSAESSQDGTVQRVRTWREPCPCQCKCGSSKDSTAELCYTCTRGLHHVCTTACAEFPEVSLGSVTLLEARLLRERGNEQVKDTRRDHKFSGFTAFIPKRPACDGGADAGINPRANRHFATDAPGQDGRSWRL